MYFQLLLFLFVAILLMIWVKWVERRSITSLGFFQKRKAFKEIAKSWGFGSLIISLSFALTYLFGGVYFTDMDFSLLIILYVLSLIPFWFIQSGTEELLTRGWLLPLLNRRFNLALAVGVSSGFIRFDASSQCTCYLLFNLVYHFIWYRHDPLCPEKG